MATSMEVILLERVDNLGSLGDRVSVKPGYARNCLLPQSKALRATKSNIAYFAAQKKEIEKQNEATRKEAEKLAKKLEGLTIILVRLASESGQLYGSVTAKDISEAICAQSSETLLRNQVEINQTYKMIGIFPVTLALHPEVKIDIMANIARSEEEAKIQGKTGKALVADNEQEEAKPETKEVANDSETKSDEAAEKAKKKMLEEGVLEAEQIKAEETAVKEAEKEEKIRIKAEAKAAKEAAEAEAAALEAASEEGTEEETVATEEESSEDTEK